MVALFQTEFAFSFPWPAQVFAVLNKYPNPLAPHVVSVDVIDRSIMPDGTIRSERLIGVQQDSPKWINKLIGQPDTTFAREVSFVVPSSLANPAVEQTVATATAHLEPPKLLMASTNLTLANVMQCRESISYLPHPWPHLPKPTASQLAPSLAESSTTYDPERPDSTSTPPPAAHPLSHPLLPDTTLFSQSALIFSTGLFASQRYPPFGISRASPIEPLSNPRANTLPQRALGKKVEQWGAARFETNAESGRSAMQLAAQRLWEAEWASLKANMSAA